MLNRNALHALMGLEATPIKAGGFKYIHRDTGLIFEIAPATSDSAGVAQLLRIAAVALQEQLCYGCTDVLCNETSHVKLQLVASCWY